VARAASAWEHRAGGHEWARQAVTDRGRLRTAGHVAPECGTRARRAWSPGWFVNRRAKVAPGGPSSPASCRALELYAAKFVGPDPW